MAGYSVATATGIMRVLNNRHWVSDVLSGAGIGIMSTELAYALGDVIFKGKGLLRNDKDSVASIITHPSFFAISMGIGWGSKNLDFHAEDEEVSRDLNMKFRSSTMVGVEGAYFINPYIGFGGRLRLNTSPINGWDRVLDYAKEDLTSTLQSIREDADFSDLSNIVFTDDDHKPEYTIESDHLTEFAYDLGVYGNLPLSRHFAIGAKLLGGRSIMQELNLKAHYQGQKKDFGIDVSDPENPSVKLVDMLDDNGNKQTYDTSWDYFVPTTHGRSEQAYRSRTPIRTTSRSAFSPTTTTPARHIPWSITLENSSCRPCRIYSTVRRIGNYFRRTIS